MIDVRLFVTTFENIFKVDNLKEKKKKKKKKKEERIIAWQ